MENKTNRRAHKKTKTGCITCKARRVKCDEERPACHRCLKAGKPCGGYDTDTIPQNDPMQSNGGFQMEQASTCPNTVSPYFGGAMTPLEFQSLQFFHERTVPSLCGFFESDLWQKLLLQISHTEPGLRHAMIAVGFLQKLSDLYGVPAIDFQEGQGDRLDQLDAFALKQYVTAVQLVRERLQSRDPNGIVTLVACILFVCLELLRGERKAAYAHLKSGQEIIKGYIEAPAAPNHSKSLIPFRRDTVDAQDLAPVFARIGFYSTLHRLPKTEPFVGLLDLQISSRNAADPFQSVAEARTENINLLNATVRYAKTTIMRAFPSDEVALAAREQLRARLKNWCEAFEQFLARETFRSRPPLRLEDRGVAILRAHHLICEIWVDVVRCPQDEWSYDLHLDSFKIIVHTVESVIRLSEAERRRTGLNPTNFTLDDGLIAPLFFAATKCRDPFTRRRAIELLHETPRREGIWDALQCAKIAEIHVAAEEEPLAQPSNTHWPPVRSRIIDFDITMRSERDPSLQLVTLRMVRKDGCEEPERRTQTLHYEGHSAGLLQRAPVSSLHLKEAILQNPITIFESLAGVSD